MPMTGGAGPRSSTRRAGGTDDVDPLRILAIGASDVSAFARSTSAMGPASVGALYLFGTNAFFLGADLSRLDLATVQVPGGQFYNSDLSGADLSSAYLVRSRFENVNVDGADLSGADLTDVISSGLTGTPLALPAGWSISGGTLVYNG